MSNISPEDLVFLRTEAKRILQPHVEHGSQGLVLRDAHLRALHADLTGRNVQKAKNYILTHFLKILAYQEDSKAESVMIITSALYDSEEFRDMICDVVKEIIEETVHV